jgi:hypothetical protein
MDRSRKRTKSMAEMAVGALEPQANPLDMPMARFDPSPTSLGLDDAEESEMCSNSRCSCRAVDECIICGQSLCGECVAEDED